MAERNFLMPTKIPNASDFGKRRDKDGQFRNPPTYSKLGGFTSADKGRFDNGLTLEKGGPTALKGRPI